MALIGNQSSASLNKKIADIEKRQKFREELAGYRKPVPPLPTTKKRSSGGGGGGSSKSPKISTPRANITLTTGQEGYASPKGEIKVLPSRTTLSSQLSSIPSKANISLVSGKVGFASPTGDITELPTRKTVASQLGGGDVGLKLPSKIDVAKEDYRDVERFERGFFGDAKEYGKKFLGMAGFGAYKEYRDKDIDAGGYVLNEKILTRKNEYYDPNKDLIPSFFEKALPPIKILTDVFEENLRKRGFKEETKAEFQYRQDKERETRIQSSQARIESELQGEINQLYSQSTSQSISTRDIEQKYNKQFQDEVKQIKKDIPTISNIGGRRDLLGQAIDVAVVSNPFTNVIALGESAKDSKVVYKGDLLGDIKTKKVSFAKIERKPTTETLLLAGGQLAYGGALLSASRKAVTRASIEDSFSKAQKNLLGKYYAKDKEFQFVAGGFGKTDLAKTNLLTIGDDLGSVTRVQIKAKDYATGKDFVFESVGGSYSKGSIQAPTKTQVKGFNTDVIFEDLKTQVSVSKEFNILRAELKNNKAQAFIKPDLKKKDTFSSAVFSFDRDKGLLKGYTGEAKNVKINLGADDEGKIIISDISSEIKDGSKFVLSRSDKKLFESLPRPGKSGLNDITKFYGGGGKKTPLSKTFTEKAPEIPFVKTKDTKPKLLDFPAPKPKTPQTLKQELREAGINLPSVRQQNLLPTQRFSQNIRTISQGLTTSFTKNIEKSKFSSFSAQIPKISQDSFSRNLLRERQLPRTTQKQSQFSRNLLRERQLPRTTQKQSQESLRFEIPKIEPPRFEGLNLRGKGFPVVPLIPSIPSFGEKVKRRKTKRKSIVGRTPSFTAIALNITGKKKEKFEGALSIRKILTNVKENKYLKVL